jgi:hypothetical protein
MPTIRPAQYTEVAAATSTTLHRPNQHTSQAQPTGQSTQRGRQPTGVSSMCGCLPACLCRQHWQARHVQPSQHRPPHRLTGCWRLLSQQRLRVVALPEVKGPEFASYMSMLAAFLIRCCPPQLKCAALCACLSFNPCPAWQPSRCRRTHCTGRAVLSALQLPSCPLASDWLLMLGCSCRMPATTLAGAALAGNGRCWKEFVPLRRGPVSKRPVRFPHAWYASRSRRFAVRCLLLNLVL